MKNKLNKRNIYPFFWQSIFINFIASLLAFSLTFFFTQMQQRRIQQKYARVVALSDIDEYIANFDVVIGYYDKFRRQYEKIMECGIDNIPDSIMDEFIAYVEGWDVFAIKNGMEFTMSESLELYSLLGEKSVPLVRRIGNCAAYRNAFIEAYKRDLQEINDLSKQVNLQGMENNYTKCRVLMQSPSFKNYMTNSVSISMAYHNIVSLLKKYNAQNKKDMNVDSSEINKLVGPQHWAENEYDDYLFIVGPDM